MLGDAVLVTTHRRESWGEPMARTANAVARLAKEFEDIRFVVPAHLNPVVREVLLPPLQGLHNVLITEPLRYSDFAHAMFASTLILTDSGGVQEEAPSLGKPVLVLRDTTERPEAVEAGTVKLVGTDEQLIVDEARQLLTDASAYDEMAHAVNPYGDGHAAVRTCYALEWMFGLRRPSGVESRRPGRTRAGSRVRHRPHESPMQLRRLFAAPPHRRSESADLVPTDPLAGSVAVVVSPHVARAGRAGRRSRRGRRSSPHMRSGCRSDLDAGCLASCSRHHCCRRR